MCRLWALARAPPAPVNQQQPLPCRLTALPRCHPAALPAAPASAVTNPTLPPYTPATITTATGLVLGIDSETGVLTFVDPSSGSGTTSGNGTSTGTGTGSNTTATSGNATDSGSTIASGSSALVLVSPSDPTQAVQPGDTAVLFSPATGKYCAFTSTTGTGGCGPTDMVCNVSSPQDATQLTYE